ncbi:MAG: YdiU family protein [Bdellovibrionales bacterium]|nr:YdiU family protein [Ramlibacter sp.]
MNKAFDGPTGTALNLAWHNEFAGLGEPFYTRLAPTPLPSAYWVARSDKVARLLGLEPAWADSDASLQALTGNRFIDGTDPLASVYSGHQFGVWAGQLGDGRAILLGETGAGLEVQLKGSGATPYSRMGDGRAVLRSSIREFLASEAMYGLGIPTSRALCITGSDAPVRRETVETAAVVTRVAPSFIRFGHFEHFSSREQYDDLRTLADYVIRRYYPACASSEKFAGNPYANLLEAVSERTAVMVAAWQAVGFCHGVMNTDNMSILGLTIDYGPFQFLDGFDPAHICNHSDNQGRYAYNKQPNVAYWNLFCLGQALLPLIGEQELAIAALESYKAVFPAQLEDRMRSKLGLLEARDEDRQLIDATLRLLASEQVDYTIFWRRLSRYVADGATPAAAVPVRDLFIDRAAFDAWLLQYSQRIEAQDAAAAGLSMLATNPKFILRNHLGEEAIQRAKLKDFSGVHTLLRLLDNPFDEHAGFEAQAGFPPDWARSIEISCSS